MSACPKGAPVRGAVSWALLGLLGLVAAGAGVLLPRGLGDVNVPGPAAASPAPVTQPPGQPADPLGYTPPPLPDVPSMRAMLVRLVLGTGFVLALCGATLWAARRWVRPFAPQTSGQQLRVVEAVPLGGRCAVYLLQAGRCRVLAGLDGSGLKVLIPLPDPFDAGLPDLPEPEAE